MKKKYCVYVLFYQSKPVYVGCTSQMRIRLSQHKKNGKVFNTYSILELFEHKKEALAFERGIIKYLTLTGLTPSYNTEYPFIVLEREFKFNKS